MLRVFRRRTVALLLAVTLIATSAALSGTHHMRRSPARAQEPPSATPVQLSFPTFTPTAPETTATPTRTATVDQTAIEAEAISNNTNVRAGPDINESPLGQISPGSRYTVLGRRFDWYHIVYPDSPTGTAWVYKDVVTLTGDPNLIPEMELEDIPTLDPGFFEEQQTLEAVQETPGGASTLTAIAQVTPTGVFTAGPEDLALTREPGAPLPTFTYPPTVTPLTIPEAAPVTAARDSGIPPLIPIAALGAFGLLGLLIGILRRL